MTTNTAKLILFVYIGDIYDILEETPHYQVTLWSASPHLVGQRIKLALFGHVTRHDEVSQRVLIWKLDTNKKKKNEKTKKNKEKNKKK